MKSGPNESSIDGQVLGAKINKLLGIPVLLPTGMDLLPVPRGLPN